MLCLRAINVNAFLPKRKGRHKYFPTNNSLIQKKCLLLHPNPNRVKKIALNILLVLQKLKYPIVILLGVVLVTFVDEYSLVRYIQLRNEIRDTRAEIARFSAQYERDTKKLHDLRHNPRAVEKMARELYFMKTDDEDIFVLSDDPREATNIMNNETTE